VLTFSRMSMLMIPVIVLIECLYSFRSRQGRVAMVAFGVIAIAVGLRVAPQDAILERIETIGPYLEATLQGGSDDLDTTSSRGFHIRVALAVFRDHPIIGAGHMGYGVLFRDEYQFEVPGRDMLYVRTRSSHGSFWGFLADFGVVGTALWSLGLLAAAAALWKAQQHLRRVRIPPPDSRLLVHAVSVVLFAQVAFMIYAEIHARKTFWVILGLAAALERLAAREAAAHAEEVESPRAESPGTRPAGFQPSTGGRV
jgi:O-antigen ligase